MNIIDFILGPSFGKILDKIFPDQTAKAQAQLEILKMQQAGELAELQTALESEKAQGDVNKVEAASPDPFASRWRPFIGWVCGTGLATQFIISPFVTWGSRLAGHPVDFPPLDMGTLLTLLLGMLGLGGLRTAEKIKGVA